MHGDAKPGNFAFVGDQVSAVFDWELTTVGDPLTDIGYLELLWRMPVGIPSHDAALTIDEVIDRYESAEWDHRPESPVVQGAERFHARRDQPDRFELFDDG